MNKMIYILISLFISLSCFGVEDSTLVKSDSLKESVTITETIGSDSKDLAVIAYNEGNFQGAVDLLEEEIKAKKAEGLESASLYYNLGNAYFRLNELGKARLNYERAALLDPSDKDIQHNIDYVTTRIEDKIIVKDTIFLSEWFKAVQNIFNSDVWAILGVVFFLLFIACLVAFFFTQRILIKKISFYIGIVVIVFVVLANIFASNQKRKLTERDTAVITSAVVSVVASPDINSKELFMLHSGTKVSVRKDDRNWLEIEIDDGSVGWIERDKLEII